MAKKRKKGALLLGAATMVVSGIAAYKHRKEIEQTVQTISDQIAAVLEDEGDFFIVETVEETTSETGEQALVEEEKTSAPPVVDETDLAD